MAACSSQQDDSRLRQAFQAYFKDPTSLQFEDVMSNDETICGQVNGKNGFGAYGGFELFIFDRRENQLYLYGDDNGPKFVELIQHCADNSKMLTLAMTRISRDVNEDSKALKALNRH